MPAAVGRDLAGPRLRAGGPREVGRIEALAAVAVDKAAQVTPRAQGKAARRRLSSIWRDPCCARIALSVFATTYGC